MTTRVLRTAAMHGVRYPELVTKTSSRGVPGGRSPGQIPHVSGPDGMLGPLRAAQPEPGERVFATDEVPAIWSGDAVQRPPRLLLTLLGDYWWRRTEPLPSAARGAVPPDPQQAADHVQERAAHRGPAQRACGPDTGRRRPSDLLVRPDVTAMGWDVEPRGLLHPRTQPCGP